LVGDRRPPELVYHQARAFATLCLEQQKTTARLLKGHKIDSGKFVSLCNASHRILKNLGLLPVDNGDRDDGEFALERYVASKQQTKTNGAKRTRIKRDGRSMRLVKE